LAAKKRKLYRRELPRANKPAGAVRPGSVDGREQRLLHRDIGL
jgi:hypothetical protein